MSDADRISNAIFGPAPSRLHSSSGGRTNTTTIERIAEFHQLWVARHRLWVSSASANILVYIWSLPWRRPWLDHPSGPPWTADSRGKPRYNTLERSKFNFAAGPLSMVYLLLPDCYMHTVYSHQHLITSKTFSIQHLWFSRWNWGDVAVCLRVLYRAQHLRLFIDTSVCVCESTPEEEIAPGGTIDVRRRIASARTDRSSVYVQIYSAEQLRKNEKKKNETIQQSLRSIMSLTAHSSCCHHRSVYSPYSICPAVPFQSKKKTQNRAEGKK